MTCQAKSSSRLLLAQRTLFQWRLRNISVGDESPTEKLGRVKKNDENWALTAMNSQLSDTISLPNCGQQM